TRPYPTCLARLDQVGRILYANAKYDKSDDVLLALGYKPAKKDAAGSGKSGSGAPSTGGDKAPAMEQEPKK
ncbi:MAG TPA: hypothetical protein PLI08_03100, partial [Bacteroidia bacterium]|nr:hypothetical protein [Bacteroidia bacterium]